MGAFRAWVVFGFGLFMAWLTLTLVEWMNGVTFSIVDYLNGLGIIDPTMQDVINNTKNLYVSLFTFAGLIIFGSMIIYLYIESMRRRPEEY